MENELENTNLKFIKLRFPKNDLIWPKPVNYVAARDTIWKQIKEVVHIFNTKIVKMKLVVFVFWMKDVI